MPIGFEAEDAGGGPSPAPVATDPLDPWGHPAEPPPEQVAAGYWAWVEVEQEEVYEVVYTVWTTQDDGAVCPECGPLAGDAWEEGEGPVPPLHPNCRCSRVYGWSEWQTRTVTVWEERWFPA